MSQTPLLLLEKLVAGASTRADLISYWNSNADILDTLLQSLHVGSAASVVFDDTACASFFVEDIQLTIGIDTITSPYPCWIQPRHRLGIAMPLALCPVGGSVGIGFTNPLAILAVNGGLNVGSNTDPGDNNLYVVGDCSASTFTDHTPAFTGDALAAIQDIRTKDGAIDHATLPEFAISPCQDESGEWWPGRSLGDMVSVLTVAIQQLAANYDAAIAERDSKIEKLSKRIDEIAAKLPA